MARSLLRKAVEIARRMSLLLSADEGAFDSLCERLAHSWVTAALEATGTATLRRR